MQLLRYRTSRILNLLIILAAAALLSQILSVWLAGDRFQHEAASNVAVGRSAVAQPNYPASMFNSSGTAALSSAGGHSSVPPNARDGGAMLTKTEGGIHVDLGHSSFTLLLRNATPVLELASNHLTSSLDGVLHLLSQLYRQEHGGRAQPPGFEGWWQFAISQGCLLDGYHQIEQDLKPYRDAYHGAMPAALLHQALNLTAVLSVQIRNGTVSVSPDLDLWPFGAAAARWRSLLSRFAHRLPDMRLPVNTLDAPRVWVAPLPGELDAKLEARQLPVLDAFLQRGCQATPALRAARQHLGLFISPDTRNFDAVRALLPVLSAVNLPGCFEDIRAPTLWDLFRDYNSGKQDTTDALCLQKEGRNALHARVPRWQYKKARLVWRGSTTGGYAYAGAPRQRSSHPRYLHMHRQRLVAVAAALNSSLLDVGFTNFTQCDREACERMEQVFGRAAHMTPAQLFSHKYLLVVGGNSNAERLQRYLCSDSLVFLANVMPEWYHTWLQPHVHYVPVKPDYSDLLSQVQWAMQHDVEAQQIVRNANAFVWRYLRAECIECFVYRLLLEYSQAVGALAGPSGTVPDSLHDA